MGWFGIAAVDQAAKQWICSVAHTSRVFDLPSASWSLWGRPLKFQIVYVTNRGAAWGLLANQPYLLNALRVLLIGTIFFLVRRNQKMFARARFCWIAIAVAALSNLCDVGLYGHIVDLFHVSYGAWEFPAFNVADAVICIAWFALFVDHLRSQSTQVAK